MMDREELLETVRRCVGGGKYAEAAALLDALLREAPGDPSALFEQGKLLRKQGRTAEALARYGAAIKGQPANAHMFRELALLCEELRFSPGAVSALEAAAGLCAGTPDALFELSRAFREAGREAAAAEGFRRILAMPGVSDDRYLHNKVLNELEVTERRTVLESKPRSLVAMVVDRCNIHCRICRIWKGKWQASERTMREIADLFPYMEDICWEGGEVLLMDGFNEILAEGARCPHFKQNIFTNGLAVDEQVLRSLESGRADIVFSIDATDRETYEYIRSGASYDRLIKVLEMVRDYRRGKNCGIETYLNPVIMRSNHRQLEEFVEFGRKYDFHCITFTPLRGTFGDENIFEQKDEAALAHLRRSLPLAIERAKEYGILLNNWLPVELETTAEADAPAPRPVPEEGNGGRMICYAPWQRLTIDSEGEVRPFVFCLNRFIGNVDRTSIAGIWNGEGMQWYRRRIAERDFSGLCQPECISGQVRDKICRIE